MTLPQTQGWLLDYVTAKRVFESGDNELINTLTQMCEAQELLFCSCEDADFRKHPKLRPPFLDDNNCRVGLSGEIVGRVIAVMNGYNEKPFVPGDRSTKFIVATALECNYGIISDRSSVAFATPRDLALSLNIVTYTSDEFKGLL